MPALGPDYDLAVRLRRLEDAVARLQANPYGQAFSSTQSDGSIGVQISEDPTSGATAMVFLQGPTSSRDPNTNQHPMLLYIGQLYSGGQPVDSGAIWYRPTGTESAVIGNKGVQIFDPKGNRMFGTDEYASGSSGEGLTDPFLNLPFPVALDAAKYPKTTSGSWTSIAQMEFIAVHSRLFHYARTYADSGTTGNARIQLVDGNANVVATGATAGIASGTFGSMADTLALPAGFYRQGYTLNVQAQVTSGTGNVYAQTFVCYGLGYGG